MAVSNERTALLKKASDLFLSGDLQAGARQMKRAVALEKYNRRIDTRTRRLMKFK